MDEKRFKELLFENNKLLLQEMDNKIKDNNKYLLEEMDTRMDNKIKENNKYLLDEMDTRMDSKIKENNEYLLQEMEGRMDKMMDKKIFESERRQNQKLARLEHEYGDKISAIFDKIVSMEEILLNTRADSIKNENKIEEHDDMLFSHDFRISKLEEQVYSK